MWLGALSKGFALAITASVLISFIIGIATGFITFATTGEFRPLLDSTAGVLFNSDQETLGAVMELKDTDAHVRDPQKYNDDYMSFLKQRALIGIALIFFAIFFFTYALRKLSGIQQFDFMSSFLYFLFAIGIVGFLQVLYTVLTQGAVVVPYQGVIHAILNFNVFFIEPQTIAQEPIGWGISFSNLNLTWPWG